jgi:hypothetical protein
MNGEDETELQRLRFEFERDLEERKLALEGRKLEQGRRESMSRIIGNVFIGGLLSAAIAGFGIYSEHQQNERAQARQEASALQAAENRRSEMLIQLVNAREGAVTELRANMFDSLLRNYFERQEEISKITVLKLLGLNFRDAILIKPLFEMLEKELAGKDEQLRTLRKAARSIVRDQVEQIRLARDGAVCTVSLALREQKEASCMPDLRIELVGLDPDPPGQVQIRTNSWEGMLLKPEEMDEKGEAFSVNFFDMPMIDYTSVATGPDETWKYAIVLNSISPEEETKEARADLTVAVLPTDSYSTQRAYGFDELLADFIHVDREPPELVEPESADPASEETASSSPAGPPSQ